MVEGYFVLNIFSAFFDLNFDREAYLKDEYKHDNGFDPDVECTNIHFGGVDYEKKCCGEYPETRSPYKDWKGRGCCGTRTYNGFLNQCCADGETIKPIFMHC